MLQIKKPLSLFDFKALVYDKLERLDIDLDINPLETWRKLPFIADKKMIFYSDERSAIVEQCNLSLDLSLGKLAICLAIAEKHFSFHEVDLIEFKFSNSYKLIQPFLALKTKNEILEIDKNLKPSFRDNLDNYQILSAWEALYAVYLIFKARLSHVATERKLLAELAYELYPDMYFIKEEMIDVCKAFQNLDKAVEIAQSIASIYSSPIALDTLARNTKERKYKSAWTDLFIKENKNKFK